MQVRQDGPEPRMGAVLVVGGGIAGQRAALDLAEAGIKVYLVESSSSLGGKVAQIGMMFPTHDCVLCRGSSDHGHGCSRPTISPAFLDHSKHPNIDIMTMTEVSGVSGSAGSFTVSLSRQPRYVDPTKCTSCGACEKVCPVELPSEFQLGLATQKAIHKTAPRSAPDAYIVNKGDYCLNCNKCVEVCAPGAIDLQEQERVQEVEVGAIILAPGFQLYDPALSEEFGHGRYTNVLTGLELERLLSRTGPTFGSPKRPSDGSAPKRVAWLQCIGSRDQNHNYCSSICCMFATKEAILMKQREPDVQRRVFMMDDRAFNKE
ncbi:MAG: FAD-dependent oxidoreductase [Chloroflexi bacterium]|nr:FAD-dependent oxidoreductase [Chloroflexota bacterium]